MELMKSSSMNFQLRKTYLVALLGHTDATGKTAKTSGYFSKVFGYYSCMPILTMCAVLEMDSCSAWELILE